jgi:hypothetical protein
MSDQASGATAEAAPVAAVDGPPPDNTPAVKAPPKTIPHPDVLFAEMQKRIKAAEKPPEAKPTDAKPGDDAPPPDLKMPPKALKEIGRLQGLVREAEAKAKDFDTLKPDAEAIREIRTMWKGDGQSKLAALGKILGTDPTDELASLVTLFYENEAEGEDKGAVPAASPEIKQLLSVISDLKKEVGELRTSADTRRMDETKAAQAASDKASADFTRGLLAKNKARFEISNRAENVEEAIGLVQSAAVAIAKRDGIDLSKPIDQATSDRLLDEAMQETEREYEALGKRFGKAAEPAFKFTFDPARHVRRMPAPSVTPETQKLPTEPNARYKALLERQKAKAANGEY